MADVPPDTPGAPDFSITNLPEVTVTASRLPPPPAAPVSAATPAAAPPTGKLWLRAFDLTMEKPGGTTATPIDVGTSKSEPGIMRQGGNALTLADFRCEFAVEQGMLHFPWKMTATIYNVPPDLEQLICQQFTLCSLVAGYQLPQPTQQTPAGTAAGPGVTFTHDAQGNLVGERAPDQVTTLPQGYSPGGSLLFSGSVVWFERGRMPNSVDSFFTVYCNNFDESQSLAVVNTTLPPGHTPADVVQACVDAMAQYPSGANGDKKVTVGQITSGLDDTHSPRARTCYGMARDPIRDIAQTAGGFAHIDDGGRLNIMKPGETLGQNPIIIINTQTGMVGVPRQNIDGGIQVTCLLNPKIRPGMTIQINQKDIIQKMIPGGAYTPGAPLPEGVPEELKGVLISQMAIRADGHYTVWSVTHHGDTRGQAWYSEIMTRPLDPTSGGPKIG